jgi:hypothetical protein
MSTLVDEILEAARGQSSEVREDLFAFVLLSIGAAAESRLDGTPAQVFRSFRQRAGDDPARYFVEHPLPQALVAAVTQAVRAWLSQGARPDSLGQLSALLGERPPLRPVPGRAQEAGSLFQLPLRGGD